MVLGLTVVVLEDLGVESLMLVDGLAGNDGSRVRVIFGLDEFLHGLVADVDGVELLVVQLWRLAGRHLEGLAAVD